MEWRGIPKFSNFEVSEYGDIRRACASKTRSRHHQYKPYVNSDGYLAIGIVDDFGEKKTCLIHRLVALAFIGPPPSDHHEVAHRNGSRLFNHPLNLRWATRLENHSDLQIHERALKGERNGRAKITEEDVRFIRQEYALIKTPGSGRSPSELDEMFGINRSTMLSIAKGKTWTHVR